MIKLYRAKITDFTQADYTDMYSLLERAIKDKIDTKKQEYKKKQSLAGYILFYRATCDLFGQTKLKITFNENGKPLCERCFFNISHSGDFVVCAVGDEPVGVDIQQIKTIKKRSRYKFLNQKEIDYVNQCDKLVSERYLEVFTKKEAALKMLGLSMSSAASIDTFSSKFCFQTYENDGFYLTVCTKNVSIM